MDVTLKAPNGVQWVQPLGLFINNEWVKSSSGEPIPSINPATEEEICAPHGASPDDVDKAVKAARAAYKHASWKRLSGEDRGKLLYRLADLVEKHTETLATIETLDNGKPYMHALYSHLPLAVTIIRYYAGYCDKIHGQTIDCGPDKMAYTLRTPMGVVGQIIPWNVPVLSVAAKLAPALASGNTIVFKASEVCPLIPLYFANLVKEAGFPAGVVNIMNGYGRTAGAAIASHMGIDKVSFTGSTATGKEILRLASSNMKNVTLETGGKSPAIVFDDADLDNAALWTHIGIMANSGQMCSGSSRVLVQDKIYDAFLQKYKAQVEKVSVVGDPFEQTTFQGPQVSKTQHERVLGYVDSAKSEGATIYMGGQGSSPAAGGKGYYVEPTVFTDVKPHMRVYREEIFGPCVVIVPFKTEEEALEMANDTTYGLAASVFTNNVARAHRVAREFESGTVCINMANANNYNVPFGGAKQSGVGTELGEQGLYQYSYIKSVILGLGA